MNFFKFSRIREWPLVRRLSPRFSPQTSVLIDLEVTSDAWSVNDWLETSMKFTKKIRSFMNDATLEAYTVLISKHNRTLL